MTILILLKILNLMLEQSKYIEDVPVIQKRKIVRLTLIVSHLDNLSKR